MAQILCFGDSITHGYVDLDGGWTQRLRRRLDQQATFPLGDTRFPAHATFNPGVADDTSEGLLDRLEPELRPRLLGDQTIVVIAIGVNETAFELAAGRRLPGAAHDGLHPNGAGHQLLADRIGDRVGPWL